MKTARVDFLEQRIGGLDGAESLPTTLIALNPSDKQEYAHFRESHKALESIIRELSREESEARENEVREQFKRFINPYLEQLMLAFGRCQSYYGGSNLPLLSTPPYALFSEQEPFSFGYEIKCSFSPSDSEDLLCQSGLVYFSGNHLSPNDALKPVVNKLFGILVEHAEQNKKPFALIQARGDFTYFAPLDSGPQIMLFIRDIAMKIGPEKINELVELRNAYLEQTGRTFSRNEPAIKALREAYETTARLEMVRAKLIDPV